VLVAALEGDPGELGDAVDETGDRLPEQLRDLLETRARVLDGVVQQRRAQGLRVEPQAGADLRDLDRMGDEVLARLAALVGVTGARERERAGDRVAIDRRLAVARVLADDREQVAEQRALLGIEALGQLADRGGDAVRLVLDPDPRVTAAVGGTARGL
jgi:hypothetical protein